MRDPKRIDEVLEELKTYWDNNPDLRLGQIICNVGRAYNMEDPFYLEDDKLIYVLKAYNDVQIVRDKYAEAYNKLEEIKKLPDNWNHNGAKKFSPELIDNCKSILKNLNHPPFIAPTANDSIQFEYDGNIHPFEDGNYLEFNVSLGFVEVYRIQNNGITGSLSGGRTVTGTVEEISNFMKDCVDSFFGEHTSEGGVEMDNNKFDSKDVISRGEAICLITNHPGVVDKSVAKKILLQMAPAEEVGHWVEVPGYATPGGDPVWQCSKCGKGRHVYGIKHDLYRAAYRPDIADGQWLSCPNCGIKMEV